MQIDSATAAQLGWPEILETLADHALTPQGKAACLDLAVDRDPDEIRRKQERCRQLQGLLDDDRHPPIESIEEIEEDIERATKQGILSAEAILRVGRVMAVSSRLRNYLMTAGHDAGGALVELARGTTDLSAAGRDLLEAFDESGTLRDSASPELGPLRKKTRLLADGIRTRLERLMHKPKVAACLTDTYITQRSDRYVLPVRADTHEPVPGIVHDASQSGATLFIEPADLVEDGNRLKIARAEVGELERRILAEYTAEIAGHVGELESNLACVAQLDCLAAAIALGQQLRGSFIETGGSGFNLLQARHPLMALGKEEVVPNDIRLAAPQSCLVVTGPNAGGKTVTLKTIGLVSLMTQAGLPVPAAENSRISLFGKLCAVIGDAQDIHRGLSSFSAHISRIVQILTEAGPDTLVLLDEITSDTDPRHGAALASSLLQSLIRRQATTVVTTHFEDLKQLAYADEHFANASVGFDLDNMEPTYNLHPDVPGRSLTLEIARRLGVDEQVLDEAAERLEESTRDMDVMLTRLEEERQAMSQLRRQLQARIEDADRRAGEHEQATRELSKQKDRLQAGARRELLEDIKQARRKVADMIEALRRNPSMPAAVETSRELKETENSIIERQRAEVADRPPAAGDLQPGDMVRVTSLDKQARVLSVDRKAGMVSVGLGVLRSRLPLEQVEKIADKPPRKRASVRSTGERASGGSENGTQVRTPANTLDLRGLHVDDSLATVDKFLDDLFANGEDSAFIIHGHGTGALKTAIREYLRDSPYPRNFRSGTPEEGGDGVTVVRLK